MRSLLGRGLGLLAVCAATLALAGCGGIEFQGKIFDYAGLSGSGNKEDVRMTERAPLLVPPDTKRLPPPGPAVVTPANWPIDSDLSRKQATAARVEAERQKAAEAEPNNPYAGKPNLLDNILGRRKKDDTETLDVPEPDPTDKTAADRARESGVASAPAKPIDHSLNSTPPPEDPFHPAAPDSYKGMSNPSGNNASW
ncbi:MAG: hypothetical protein WBF23_02655 [Methyloceanibacter sp.]